MSARSSATAPSSRLHSAGIGLGGAAIAGVLSAVLTRFLMHAIAVIANREPSFSLIGSLIILAVYVLALAPGAVALAVSGRWWSKAVFAVGVIFLVYGAVTIGIQETQGAQDLTAGRRLLLAVVIAAMSAVYVVQVTCTWRWAVGARNNVERHRQA